MSNLFSLFHSKHKIMKNYFLGILCFFATLTVIAQTEKSKSTEPDKNKPVITAEVSCGQCQLGLPGKTCDLAIRIDKKAYFIDGTKIDSHGDAHANDGFCNSIRKAKVQGELLNDRYQVTYFELLPEKVKKNK